MSFDFIMSVIIIICIMVRFDKGDCILWIIANYYISSQCADGLLCDAGAAVAIDIRHIMYIVHTSTRYCLYVGTAFGLVKKNYSLYFRVSTVLRYLNNPASINLN